MLDNNTNDKKQPSATVDLADGQSRDDNVAESSGSDKPLSHCQQCPVAADNETSMQARSMELNEAFEALEHMRRANLEVELGAGSAAIDFNRCVHCLRTAPSTGPRRQFDGRRFKALLPRNRTSLCLICGSPTCPRHGSETFRKESSITICNDCSPLFTLDFIVDCVGFADDEESHRRKHVDKIIDVYDRVTLVLKYSTQFIHDISEALERNARRKDRIGLGSNATGIVSGITGVAAAAAIFTPAGPPLLIASLFFGGSATAASTSSEAVNYFSEPSQLAVKIIALHTVVQSLLRVTSILRDALLRDHIHLDHYAEQSVKSSEPSTHGEKVNETLDQLQVNLEKETVRIPLDASAAAAKYTAAAVKTAKTVSAARVATAEVTTLAATARTVSVARVATIEVSTLANTARTVSAARVATVARVSTLEMNSIAAVSEVGSAAVVAESGVLAARNARFVSVSRASSTGLKVARFARFAGGALSAATIALEAKDMAATVKRMQAGSPCEKAEALRGIKGDIDGFPDTESLAKQCERYLQAMSKRLSAQEQRRSRKASSEGCSIESYHRDGTSSSSSAITASLPEVVDAHHLRHDNDGNDHNAISSIYDTVACSSVQDLDGHGDGDGDDERSKTPPYKPAGAGHHVRQPPPQPPPPTTEGLSIFLVKTPHRLTQSHIAPIQKVLSSVPFVTKIGINVDDNVIKVQHDFAVTEAMDLVEVMRGEPLRFGSVTIEVDADASGRELPKRREGQGQGQAKAVGRNEEQQIGPLSDSGQPPPPHSASQQKMMAASATPVAGGMSDSHGSSDGLGGDSDGRHDDEDGGLQHGGDKRDVAAADQRGQEDDNIELSAPRMQQPTSKAPAPAPASPVVGAAKE